MRSTATLNKLANLFVRRKPAGTQPAPSPAGPPGDGWGMTFLRKADRQALFNLAGDPDAALPDVMNLLSRAPGLDLAGDDGKIALLRAAQAANAGMVKVLAERGADVHATDGHEQTALHLAAMSSKDGRVQPMISALLDAGADVHARNVFGMTPLFTAASKAAVDLLLDAGADIGHCSPSGNTALLYAAMTWRPAAMCALLERDADPQATNEEGVSFIDLVRDHYGLGEGASLPSQPPALAGDIARREAEHQQVLRMFKLADDPDAALLDIVKLLACIPDLNVRDEDGETALLRAALAENAGMVKVLVDRGADVHAADADGRTALHKAATCRRDGRVEPMISALLDAGADVHAQNVLGMTPLFSAASKDAVDLLLEAGAAIDHRAWGGNTALTYAAREWKRRGAMLALLERGADPQATNKEGFSFIDMVRDHYGLGEGALPLEPTALADYIAQREVEPPQDTPTAPRVPAPAVVVAPTKRINSLPSGHKIDLVDRPHARFNELDRKDLDALSQALGFGPLAAPEEGGDAQRESIFKTLDAFAQDIFAGFADYDNEVLEHRGLLSGLSAAEQEELKAAMDATHMCLAAPRDLRGRFIMPCQLKVFFGGSKNRRDVRHDILGGFGQTSSVDRAARRIGELLAKQIRRNDNQIRIECIAGASMGGASAQTMLAVLQSRRPLDKQPSMLLLDPQLLNNRQAARATRDGPLAVDYRIPRGVAISVDYTKAPHRGLMGIMKGPGGYTYPGLVHLKLGLTDTDGDKGTAPKTSGLPGLGYHSVIRLFGLALARFTGTATQSEEGSPAPHSNPLPAQAAADAAASGPPLVPSSRWRPEDPEALRAVAGQWQVESPGQAHMETARSEPGPSLLDVG